MIKLKDVCTSYEKKEILHNINLQLEKGKIYGIIGSNGSGKTTLLKVISKLKEIDSGDITLDVKKYSDYERKEFARLLSHLPQNRPIPSISAKDLVSHGRFPYLDLSRKLREEDRQIITAALEKTGMSAFASKNLQDMSGGERQKVYISMLLAQNTDYVLLDEPTTFLDISAQFELMDIISQMKGENKCIIIVMHDISLALKYCDEIIVMDKGKIKKKASPKEIAHSEILEEVFGIKCKVIEDGGDIDYIIKKSPVK